MDSASEIQTNEETQGSLWGLVVIFIGIAMVIAFVIFTISNKASEANSEAGKANGATSAPDHPSGAQFNAIVLQATAYKDKPEEEQKVIQQEAKKIFLKQNCYSCHLMAGIAPSGFATMTQGPDLSDIGKRHDLRFIVESVLVPNAQIAEPKEEYTLSGKSKMPSYNLIISDEDLGKLAYWLSLQKGK